MQQRKSWARIGGLSETYYRVAEEAYHGYLIETENLVPSSMPDDAPTTLMQQEKEILIFGLKTVVFSAMCVEAAIFDFAAIHLGDSYSEQYLDKLDLVSKWLVIPRLACSTGLAERGAAINSLRTLVKFRNSLAHQKSKPLDLQKMAIEDTNHKSDTFPNDVHTAYKTIVLLSLELNSATGEITCVLPPFEKHVISSHLIPDRVKKVVERCRTIHLNSLTAGKDKKAQDRQNL
ncbi:MAG: hypothetical protein HYZ45_14165 [Burkholderiales bacterium]|nr:hypothetical protein [Burkholderiales bacterium]